jgi:AraC-like DNA-binding protein
VFRLSMSRFDELAEAVEELIFPVRWQAAKAVRNMPVEMTTVVLGGLTISAGALQGDVSVATNERGGYLVVMTEAGSLRSEHRGTRVRVTTSLAALYPPSGLASTSWTGPHDSPLSVKVDAAALEDHLAAHLGQPVARPIHLMDSMTTADGRGQTWAALIRVIYHDALAGWPLGSHPLIRSRLHDAAVYGLLMAAGHPYREEWFTPATALRPRPVKQAIDVIEAYPDRPLSVTAIARMVGVSARTLQDGFRRHVGFTPMAYARRVRLARVHHDLCEADPQWETVADIAHRWGFAHLGRFAAAYREIYGVTPSQTLRKEAV